MKTNKLKVQINKPPKEVFDFVTNPVNTPKWIDFIDREETDEWPPKLGTIYKNQDRDGEWRELEMTEFKQDKMFVMTNRATGYQVRYSLTPIGSKSTELEYYEWQDGGKLDDPFTLEPLQQLKLVLEKLE